MIMDSPGMGDPDFADALREKIQSACAFVYILKHFNPIGEDVQEVKKTFLSLKEVYRKSATRSNSNETKDFNDK